VNVNIYNILPIDIIARLVNKIDILEGASDKFIEIVIRLESEKDLKKRAKLAKGYIDANNYIKEVYYSDLGKYLANIDAVDIELWRQLYLLERSVPPRFGNKYTWLQRLKIFYNSFIYESAIDHSYYRCYKLLFKKGNVSKPTNHDKLVYGSGRALSDFYFFDNTIQGTTRDKMVSVEYKYGTGTLQEEIDKYAENRYIYDAKYLIVLIDEQTYYMINYSVSPVEFEQLNIKVPTGTFNIFE